MKSFNHQLPIFSVSQYNEYINTLLSIEPVIVEGEVSNYKAIPGRNFCYFDIKDDVSVARCFQGFWKCARVDFQNGTKLQIFGYPTLQKNGTFVINVHALQLSGKGALLEAYHKLKFKLEQEGVFNAEFKQPLPRFPRTIGLIAGKNSSAYHDVSAELFERWQGLTVWFLPVKVQGIYAKKEVVSAIQWFNKNLPVDVLIIARGGGSVEDLQAFDSEEVVREIFASKIPIISAIGHEDHWTLADYVADIRAKTPTKAAQLAVLDRQEVIDRLAQYAKRAESLLNHQVETNQSSLDRLLQKLQFSMRTTLEEPRQQIFHMEQQLHRSIGAIIFSHKTNIEQAEQQLLLLNPERVLARGYAVVEKGGKRVNSVKALHTNERVSITLSDGGFSAKVEELY